uniref:Mitochondrial carrier protein n=1 Tax=Macrostomum lignano TaxID=282301 RepID=A0A1I8FTH8_9PLAT
ATCSEVNKMAAVSRMSVLQCIRYIRHTEGIRGLFKGLSMTILGVLPSRAFYFGAYVNGQEMLSELLPRGSHGNNCLAAAFAGFVSLTCTNPIWLVKTRMQLDQSPKSQSLSAIRCIRTVWRQNGFLGFYRGIQASYLGIAETSLHFVVYEDLKRRLLRWSRGVDSVVVGVSRADEVLYCSIASTCSKSFATCVCYPHGTAHSTQTGGQQIPWLISNLPPHHNRRGPARLYRGMLTHFMRQIPNTCIVLTTYEGVLYFFREHKLLL